MLPSLIMQFEIICSQLPDFTHRRTAVQRIALYAKRTEVAFSTTFYYGLMNYYFCVCEYVYVNRLNVISPTSSKLSKKKKGNKTVIKPHCKKCGTVKFTPDGCTFAALHS